MGKLILRSLKRASAKEAPESAVSFLEAILNTPGIHLLLLDPVYNEHQEPIDFVVLAASSTIEKLEGEKPLKGKRIKSAMQSSAQWLEPCLLAIKTGEESPCEFFYKSENQTCLFKANFYRYGNWILTVWDKMDTAGAESEQEAVRNQPGDLLSDKNAKSEVVEKESLKNLTEKEKMSVQAHTIRTIIHEIRNPLTAIGLANQLLMESTNVEDDHQLSRATLTSIIFQNSKKIEDHLRQLLHAKPTEEISFRLTDPCKVVEAALQKAETRLLLSRVTVCRNFRPGHFIQGHHGKLSIAFLNIIINAVEAMTSEYGHLWVSVHPEGDTVKIIFRDDGAGMDKDILQRIFETSFSKKQNGLGVGLAHVKEILDMHKATISVKSAPGKGTSFILLFKRSMSDHKPSPAPAQVKFDF